MNRKSGVLVGQVGVASRGLLFLGGLLSDALDLLELVFADLRGFLKLVDDFTNLCCNDVDKNLNKRTEKFIYKISEEAIISLHEKNET